MEKAVVLIYVTKNSDRVAGKLLLNLTNFCCV